jgi:tetratricopeptide (TPR) repeat protein
MGMFAEQQVAPDDLRRRTCHSHFARNLDDILRAARRARVPVVVSTVASNLRDCAPFGSMHRTGFGATDLAGWEHAYAVGMTNESRGDWAPAIEAYAKAAALDAKHAELQYRMGRCLLALGRTNEAGRALASARDLDALPFRADAALNGAVRQAAERHRAAGVHLVDAEAVAAGAAKDGATGAESFFEHVHFTFAGNYRVGRALAEAVAEAVPGLREQRRVQEWLMAEACDRRLGLTDWNRAAVIESVVQRMQGLPFSRQADHAAQLGHWQSEWAALRAQLRSADAAAARTIYQEALRTAPGDHRLHEGYAEFLEAVGDIDGALRGWEAVRELLPHHFAAFVHTGRLLVRAGRWAAAEERLRRALELESRTPEGHVELGRALAGQGQFEAASAQYAEALRWQPGHAPAYYHLADALARQERRGEAMLALSNAVRVLPSYWEARYLLGVELALSNRVAEAGQQFAEVVRLRPDHLLARLNLGVALVKLGDRDGAAAQFQAVLRLDPKHEKARQHLEALEALRGRRPEGPWRP